MTSDKPEADSKKANHLTLIRGGAVVGFASPGQAEAEGKSAWGRTIRDGAVLLGPVDERGRVEVIAAGRVAEVQRQATARITRTVDRPEHVVMPGLVNAHAHLELTAVGPRPAASDFVGWVAALRRRTAAWTAADWRASTAAGAAASGAAGIAAVGDIVGGVSHAAAAPAPPVHPPAPPGTASANASGSGQRGAMTALPGVDYQECFGIGPPWDTGARQRIAALADSPLARQPAAAPTADSSHSGSGTGINPPPRRMGLQPHAPYSAGPAVFAAAAASGLPVCCHLAETREELQFVARGDGPFRELLEAIDKWSAEFASFYRHGLTPVQWMEPHLRVRPWLLAHCNYVSDDDLNLLAATGSSVAYCPIASEYFAHENHRYRDMLAAGINVCLGTDSILCQPADEAQPLGILPQMRRLWRRDGVDPQLLLQMGTTHGWRALGQAPDHRRLAAVRFDPADPTPPLEQVLRGNAPVQTIEA